MIVCHPRGSYPVTFTTMQAVLGEGANLMVTDRNVATAWPHLLSQAIQMEPGESTKSITSYSALTSRLASIPVRRSETVYAVGGGVIGDLVGFVAATYMRGIPYVHVPTSLLAMVDSSVGGKVGIDLPEGKNLVGAFWPPTAVTIPVDALSTLPQRQFTNGMAEVWKYGFILDPQLCDRLAREPLSTSASDLDSVIARCVELKANVVQEDPYDFTGLRAILNFGHTVGHALERETGYSSILHGEAIAIGMVAEARIGEALGITPKGTSGRIAAWLGKDGLPTDYAGLGVPAMIQAMSTDKKVEGEGLAFSLLTELGRCKLVTGVSAAEVAKILGI